jgi:hypothetical protein
VPDPGDQVVAQTLQFALLLGRSLQLGRHLVEGRRQRSQFVATCHTHARFEVPLRQALGRPLEVPKAFRYRVR